MSKALEAAAVSDAAFDGRDFHAMGRHDRERYLARSAKAITAFLDAAAGDARAIDAVWNAFDNELHVHLSPEEYGDGPRAAILALKEAVNG